MELLWFLHPRTNQSHQSGMMVGFIIQSFRNNLQISQMPNPAESLKSRVLGLVAPNSAKLYYYYYHCACNNV